MRVNFDYLNIFKEPMFFALFIARHIFKRRAKSQSNAILIVNPCLAGEFAASVPAIADFIQRNRDKKIDLMVSGPLKIIAERIKGINNTYVAHSVFNRTSEFVIHENQISPDYEKIIVLRASAGAYDSLKKISANSIKTGIWIVVRYAFHLAVNLILGRTPKQWGAVNFAMLGGVSREIPFDDIFRFNAQDYDKINSLSAIRSGKKKIIIHTGASWPMMRWENNKWIELLKKINTLGSFEFIFIGTGKDMEDYNYISSNLAFKTHSVISKINLIELLLLLRSVDYFIGVDSGPANMAHLTNLRSMVIFGPGPHMYMPSDTRDIILDKSNGRGLYQRFFLKKNGFIQQIGAEEAYWSFRKFYLG